MTRDPMRVPRNRPHRSQTLPIPGHRPWVPTPSRKVPAMTMTKTKTSTRAAASMGAGGIAFLLAAGLGAAPASAAAASPAAYGRGAIASPAGYGKGLTVDPVGYGRGVGAVATPAGYGKGLAVATPAGYGRSLAVTPAGYGGLAAVAVPASAAQPQLNLGVYFYPHCGEIMVVNSSNVRLRGGIGTSAPIEAYDQRGDEVNAIYRTTQTDDGYYWAYVQDDAHDITGYIALSLLNDTGQSAGCTHLD